MPHHITFYIFILIFIFSPIPVASTAEISSDKINKASEAYYENRFDEALEIYEALLREGAANGSIFYNIGNTYFRKEMKGRALLSYEKALRLIPRDADLRANIGLTRRALSPLETETTSDRIIKTFFFWNDFFSVTEMIWIFAGSWCLFWALLILHQILRRPLIGSLAVIAFIITLVWGASFGHKFYLERIHEWGIIVKSSVDARSTFLEEGKAILTLPEGTKLQVLSIQPVKDRTWVQIQLPQGRRGWVLDAEIGII